MLGEKAKVVLQRQIEQVVDAALVEAYSQWERTKEYPSVAEMAERIYDGQPGFMEEIKKPVLLERLYWVLKQRRLARSRENFGQMELPGLELPRRVYLRNGRRPEMDDCTTRDIDQAIKILEEQKRERRSRKLDHLKIARAMMEPYRAEKPNITWGAVKKKELERRDFERLVGSE